MTISESTSGTGVSTTDNYNMLNTITFDDYDLEFSSDDFEAPIVKRYELGESSMSANLTFDAAGSSTNPSKRTSLASINTSKSISNAFKSSVTSIETSPYPVSVENATNTTKNHPKNPSKRVIIIKTTIKDIWKPKYLQPLYDLVHTTNLLVTHTFSFTKYIFLQELATHKNFVLNEFIFVEVFLSLVLTRARNSESLKDSTKKYRRLILKHKEVCFEDAGYTPISLPNAQQIALYECTKTAYFNNIKAHFGNRLRSLINKLLFKKEKAGNSWYTSIYTSSINLRRNFLVLFNNNRYFT